MVVIGWHATRCNAWVVLEHKHPALRRCINFIPIHASQVGFGDEEGVRFGTSLLSSRVLAGGGTATSLAPLLATRDAAGTSLADALTAFGLDPAAAHLAARPAGERIGAYVELHIEQGPVLAAAGAAVGVVTAIAGFARWRVSLRGAAGHAGTVPMGRARRDALAAAAECVLAIEAAAAAIAGGGGGGAVATVGALDVQPGVLSRHAGRGNAHGAVLGAADGADAVVHGEAAFFGASGEEDELEHGQSLPSSGGKPNFADDSHCSLCSI